MPNTKIKNILEYVTEYVNLFLETNSVDEDVLTIWKGNENISKLDKIIKGYKKKEDKKNEKKVKKKNKHKDEPKRPKSPYICFCSEMRAKVLKNEPEIGNKNIMTRLGELWRALSEDEKHKWDEISTEDKTRYQTELEQFRKDHPEEIKKPLIKKPLTSYVIYCNEKRSEITKKFPGLGPKVIMSKLGESWKSETDDSKNKWVKLAEKEKERYKKQISNETEVVIEENQVYNTGDTLASNIRHLDDNEKVEKKTVKKPVKNKK